MEKDYIELNKALKTILVILKTIQKNILYVLLFGALFSGLSLLLKSSKTYTSNVTLMLTENGDGGQLMSLANSFGLGGGSEKVSFEKFKSVAFSNKIIAKTLATSYNDGFLADKIVNDYGLSLLFKKKGLMNLNYNKSSLKVDTALAILIPSVIGNLEIIEDEGDLVKVSFISRDPALSQAFTKGLIESTMDYFHSVYFQKDLSVQKIIKMKLDSIKDLLTSKEVLYAQYMDANLGYVKVQGKLKHLRLKRDIEILNEIMAESTKQFELINFKLLNIDLGVEFLDNKDYPVISEKTSIVKKLIIGFIIGIIFGCGFVVVVANVRRLRPKIQELYRNS